MGKIYGLLYGLQRFVGRLKRLIYPNSTIVLVSNRRTTFCLLCRTTETWLCSSRLTSKPKSKVDRRTSWSTLSLFVQDKPSTSNVNRSRRMIFWSKQIRPLFLGFRWRRRFSCRITSNSREFLWLFVLDWNVGFSLNRIESSTVCFFFFRQLRYRDNDSAASTPTELQTRREFQPRQKETQETEEEKRSTTTKRKERWRSSQRSLTTKNSLSTICLFCLPKINDQLLLLVRLFDES